MSNQTKFTIAGWLGFAIMLILFFQKCGCDQCPNDKTISDTVTVQNWDTAPKLMPVPYYKLVPGDSVIIKIPADVDTLAILKKYFTQYMYSNTYVDSNQCITVLDTVSKNTIIGRSISYKWMKPSETKIITNTQVAKPSRSILLGVFVASNTTGAAAGFGAQIQFQTLKNTTYDARYDFLQKRIELGAAFKLKIPYDRN